MSYIRKATSAEVFNGVLDDVFVSPQTLIENVWFFSGNFVDTEREIGTLNNFDLPILRNNVEKIRVDNVTWTTDNYITTFKIGENGSQGLFRFPLNSSVQHGVVGDTDGSLKFILANGESSGSTAIATPIYINASGGVGLNTSPSTAFDVSGAIRFRTFSTPGNLLSVLDVNGNITSVSPSTIAASANAFIQNGNTFGALAVLGTNDSFGLSFETNNNRAITIDTSQNVGIGTTAPEAKFHLSGGTSIHEQVDVKSLNNVAVNSDVDVGTEVITTIVKADYRAAFFDYIVASGTGNLRAGTIQSVWNDSTIRYTDFSTTDIGNTSDVVLSVAINGANVELRATTATNNWSVKTMVRTLN